MEWKILGIFTVLVRHKIQIVFAGRSIEKKITERNARKTDLLTFSSKIYRE